MTTVYLIWRTDKGALLDKRACFAVDDELTAEHLVDTFNLLYPGFEHRYEQIVLVEG